MVLAAIQSHARVAIPQLARPKSWMGYFFIHSLEYADKVGYTKCNIDYMVTGEFSKGFSKEALFFKLSFACGPESFNFV